MWKPHDSGQPARYYTMGIDVEMRAPAPVPPRAAAVYPRQAVIHGMHRQEEAWIPAIDGLRAVAVFAVILHHANGSHITNWAPGNLGVAIFYSISGFLAYYVLSRDERRLGRVDYNYFLFRRVLRIWPAYFATIAFAYFMSPSGARATANMIQLFTFTMNWDMALFKPWTLSSLPHLWSIAVEEQFYILAPFMYRLLRSQHPLIYCGLVFALSNAGRIGYVFFVEPPPTNGGLYYMTFTYSDTFLIGAMVAKSFTEGWRPQLRHQILAFWLSIVLLAAILRFWPLALFGPLPWFTPLIYATLPAACGLLLISILPGQRTLFSWFLSTPIMRYLGRLSFSLYLVHLVAQYQVQAIMEPVLLNHRLEFNLIVIATCLLCAQICYYFIERPFLTLKNKMPSKTILRYPWPATTILSLMAIGTVRLLST